MYSDINPMSADIDLEKFVAELKAPWNTMGPDIQTARSIITKHSKTETEQDTMELLSISEDEDEYIIHFPDWHSEVEDVFIHQYGLNNGKQIFKKVVMRLYLLSRGTAQQLQ